MSTATMSLDWLEAWAQSNLEQAGDPSKPYFDVKEELNAAFESGASLEVLFDIAEHFKYSPRK